MDKPAKPPCPECGGPAYATGFKHEKACSRKRIVKPRKRKKAKGKVAKIDGELILEARAEAEAMPLEELSSVALPWGRFPGRRLDEVEEKYLDELCAWVENKGLDAKHSWIHQRMLRYLVMIGNPHERACDMQHQQPASALSRRGQHKKWDPIDDCPRYETLDEFRCKELILEDGTPFGEVMTIFQKERFFAWDNHRRVYCESCTGSSKTTDIAGWCISQLYREKYFEGTIYAVDVDQAKKISNAARGFINRNIRLQGWLEVDRSGRIKRVTKGKRGRTDETYGEIIVDSSDVASAEGLITDVVICEQLESWKRVELWESIISRAHKRQMKVHIIANACFDEDDWQYKLVREIARKEDDWQFIEIEADEVRWISETDKASAKKQLRPATYARLYDNIVGAAENTMFTKDQVERMLDPKRGAPLRSVIRRPAGIQRVALGLDIGFVEDPTALCALGEDGNGDQILLNMRVWQGKKGEVADEVDFEDVIKTFRAYIGYYRPEKIIYDPHEFRGVAQKFHREHESLLHPFYFGVATITELTKQLYRCGVDARIVFYPDAGESMWKGRAISLTTEMKTVKMKETQYGYRIEKKSRRGGGEKAPTKDRVISLGMASWWLASTYIPSFHEHVTLDEEGDEVFGRKPEGFLGKRTMNDLDI